jgi:heme exporter protein D
MTWEAWLDFFAMDGYALYVWGSYAVGLALVLTELALLLFRKRAILGHLGWNGSSADPVRGPGRGAGDS